MTRATQKLVEVLLTVEARIAVPFPCVQTTMPRPVSGWPLDQGW
jgi:hypothetical protein